MVKIKMKITKRTAVLSGITKQMQPRLKKALREVGGTVTKQIKRNLSEVKRSTPPGRKYPAFQSGHLFRNTTYKAIRGPGVIIGPTDAVAYAAIHEFGGTTGKGGKTRIEARPYVWPAWEKHKDRLMSMVGSTVVGK